MHLQAHAVHCDNLQGSLSPLMDENLEVPGSLKSSGCSKLRTPQLVLPLPTMPPPSRRTAETGVQGWACCPGWVLWGTDNPRSVPPGGEQGHSHLGVLTFGPSGRGTQSGWPQTWNMFTAPKHAVRIFLGILRVITALVQQKRHDRQWKCKRIRKTQFVHIYASNYILNSRTKFFKGK